MAYKHTKGKGVEYTLHYKDVTLRGGRVQRIYFFRKGESTEDGRHPSDLPADRVVVENPRNGFLALKKK